MTIDLAAAARVVPLTALILAACASQVAGSRGIGAVGDAPGRDHRGPRRLMRSRLIQINAKFEPLTNKIWQVCNGWLMEAKRANGSPAIVFVDPKTRTVVDVDFSK